MFHIGHVIRQLRQDRGWGEEEVSTRAGINVMTLSRLESLKVDPRLSTLQKIAGVFDLKIEQLFLKLALTVDEQHVLKKWRAMENPNARRDVLNFMTSQGHLEAVARHATEQRLVPPDPPSPAPSTPNNLPRPPRRRL